MTRRIYCDRHIASALKSCPRCLEEENDRWNTCRRLILDSPYITIGNHVVVALPYALWANLVGIILPEEPEE